jgi:branched-chain amino acid transport system permease protein
MIEIMKRYKPVVGPVIGLVVLGCIPFVVTSPYYLDLYIISMVNAGLAIGFVMTLRAGLMNLGLAAFWGIGAYSTAVLTSYYGMSFWLCLPLSVLITAVFAVVIGYFLISGGGGGFGFVMLSSVVGMLFAVTVGNIRYLGGYNGIADIPKPDPIDLGFFQVSFATKVPYFYVAFVLLIAVILVSKAFYSSWAGRAWKAVSLNPRLAESLGINIFKYKLLSFVLASILVGLMGCFYAQYERYVVPNTFSMWVNVYIQIYAILGGLGHAILGPIVGSGAYTVLTHYTRSMQELTPIFLGVLLILLIMFLPQGILGLDKLCERAVVWVTGFKKMLVKDNTKEIRERDERLGFDN